MNSVDTMAFERYSEATGGLGPALSSSNHRPRHPMFDRLSPLSIILISLGVLALIECLQYYVASIGGPVYPMPPQRVSLARAFLVTLPCWIMFSAMAPGILFLARRFPLGSTGSGRNLAVHILAALLFSGVDVLGSVILRQAFLHLIWPEGEGPLARAMRLELKGYFALDVFNYIAVVAVYFAYQYFRERRQAELAAATLQTRLTEARFDALRARLDPHFIFNTLNAISALAMVGDLAGVTEMLSRFSELLRIVLREGEANQVALSTEMRFIDNYVAIHRVRFKDQVISDVTIPEDTQHALVPTLLLQPIVENVLVHGQDSVNNVTHFSISSRREGDWLRIDVTDRGPGFPSDGPAEHIGLANTRARLEELYGPEHRLTYGVSNDGGACVSVSIPFCDSRVLCA
jgi:two-component system LytT family sensor kinase